jgi:hypothetical protein
LRVSSMFAKSPVASLTERTFGYCWLSTAMSCGRSWVPVLPGIT